MIDNIWFGSCADFSKSGIIISNITDHYAFFSVFGERQASSSDAYLEISKRMLTANNREQLKNAIANYNFAPIMNINCIESSYNMFSDNLKNLYDRYCPIKNVRVKRLDVSKPYITLEIKKMLRAKQSCKRSTIKD